MSMEKADDMKSYLVGKINEFIEEKELIASTMSQRDMHNIQSFYAINDAAADSEKLTDQEKKKLADVSNLVRDESKI